MTVRLSGANREEVMSCAKEVEGATARFPTSGPRPRAGGVPVAVRVIARDVLHRDAFRDKAGHE